MDKENGRNKKKREKKKIERLKRMLGIDLCACGHKLRCQGKCREKHTNPNTGKVECGECYQIDHSEVKQGGPRRPKRTWRYGRQKEVSENQQDKDRRRERRERDRCINP